MAAKFETVDEYIASFPDDVQDILRGVRGVIHAAVPGAEEKIRYGMPAVMLGGRYAIHFAAWKHHLGLYPVPRFAGSVEDEVAPHRAEKDSVTFPYSAPIPYELIGRIAGEIAARRRQG